MVNISDISGKIDLIVEATKAGASNIFSNYTALVIILAVIIIVRLFYKSIRRIRYLLYLLIAGGYGSVLVDGMKQIAENSGITTDNIVSTISSLIQNIS